MKLPALQLGQGGLVDLLIRNGEKIGGAIVALVVSLLLWKAVSAVRLQSVQRNEMPETITQEAQQADANVTRAQDVPADLLPAYTPLAERIELWRNGKPREIAAGQADGAGHRGFTGGGRCGRAARSAGAGSKSAPCRRLAAAGRHDARRRHDAGEGDPLRRGDRTRTRGQATG
jgi:hypothetical protein